MHNDPHYLSAMKNSQPTKTPFTHSPKPLLALSKTISKSYLATCIWMLLWPNSKKKPCPQKHKNKLAWPCIDTTPIPPFFCHLENHQQQLCSPIVWPASNQHNQHIPTNTRELDWGIGTHPWHFLLKPVITSNRKKNHWTHSFKSWLEHCFKTVRISKKTCLANHLCHLNFSPCQHKPYNHNKPALPLNNTAMVHMT